jgi:hypothetical protein
MAPPLLGLPFDMTNVRSIRVARYLTRLLSPKTIGWAATMGYFTGLTVAQGATFAWDRVSSHTNLSAYILKYGGASGSYTGSVSVATNVTTATVNSFAPGRTYYLVATARNVSGVESDPSNEILFTAPGTIVNAAPVANSASASTAEDQSRAITLGGSDADGDALTFSVVSPPANGTLTGTPPNLTYLPAANFSGSDSFTFRANDGITNSAPATISITVTAVNDPPTLNAIPSLTLSTNAGQQTINLGGITSGAANENQTLTVTATSSNPTLIPSPTVTYSSPDSTGTLRFTSAANSSGTATITVTINDGQAQNNTTSRSFTVTVGTPSTRTLFIEAESGTRVAPMIVASDPNTSGGQYIYTQTDEAGSVTFTFNITLAGDYVVWCRVLSIDISSDSFYVSYDGANDDTYVTTPNSWSSAWQWTQLNGVNLGNPRVLSLSQGNHTLRFRGRESFTRLDALYITNDRNFVPPSTGTGSPNRPPTLGALSNRTISEDAGTQTVSLTGISAGTGENQPLTITATSSNPALIPSPTVAYTSPSATGTLTFTPLANANGTATITVTVDDGQSMSNVTSRTFNVTVSAVNDPPTLNALSAVTINEDAGSQTIGLSGIGTGAANETQTLTITATSSGTSLIPTPTVSYSSPNTTGTLTFRPATNASGTATITVTVNDGQSQNATVARTFTVTVIPVNDLPTISNIADQFVTQGAATAALSFTIGDAETAVGGLTLSGTSSNPSLVPNANIVFGGTTANRTVRVTPVATGFGTALITVRVTDANGGSATDTFTVTVSPANQPPTLNALGNLTINEDAGSQVLSLSGISAGATNESQTLTITATSSNPGLIPNPVVTYTSPNPTGSLTFSPAANASGAATITVTVNDGQSQNHTVTRTFTVTVNAVNDAPTISDIANQTVNESTATAALPFTIGDVETAVSGLSLSASSSNPSLVPVANIVFGGSGANRTVRVTPVVTLFGSAIITVNVRDGNGAVASDTFTLTVLPVNQAPTLNAIANLAVTEDAAQQTVNLAGISTGAANENDTLTVTAVSSNPALIPNPSVNYSSPNATGSLTFTPVANANGTATITVSVNDGQSQSNLTTRTFTVTVTSVNDPPTLNALSDLQIDEDAGPQVIPLSGISSGAANENQTLTVTATSSTPALIPNPSVSYTSPNAAGTLQFRSTTNATGTAIITVTVNDGQSQSNTVTRTFGVTVRGLNDAPTISNIPDQSINQGASMPVLTFTVGDTESPAANLGVTASSSNPSFVPSSTIILGGAGASRTLTISPPPTRAGTTIITVFVSDGGGGTTTEQFTLTVNAVNQPPTLDPISDVVVNEDSGERVVNLAGISTGAFDELQTLTVTAVSSNPGLIPNPAVNYVSPNFAGTLRFTPAANASGTAVISVTVNDGQSQNNALTRAFTVTVNPLNDSPTISNIPDQNINQNTSTAAIPFTIGDVESALGALTLAANSSNPGLIPNANIVLGGSGASRTVRVTPALNQFGSSVITVTVADGDGSVNSDSFIVTVSAVNFRPTLDPMVDLTIVEDAGPQTVSLTGISSGSASESQALTITAVSSDPGLIPHPVVNYTSPGATGTLVFSPRPDAFGAAVITVTVDDSQAQNNVMTRSFTVTVNAVNDAPTLNPIANVTLSENTVMHNVALSGITAGAANEGQALALSAVSSDPTLIPHPSVSYFSPNSSGTLTLNPSADSSGTVTITVMVNDGGAVNNLAVRTFTVTLTGTNSAPTITDLPDRSIPMNGVVSPINFVVGDVETPPGSLIVVATSSNPALVWTNNIVISGLGSPNRVASIIPTAFQHGYSIITFTVYDQNGASSSDSFVLTVVPPNVPPTLDPLPNLVLDEDSGPYVVNLTGIGPGGPNENQPLIVSAYSGNPGVIPHPIVSYSSPHATGTLTIAPASNAVGSATIVVTVNDGQGADFLVTRVFAISVNGINDPPALSSIPNQVVEQNTSTGDVPFLISDPETPPSNLSVTAFSSDQALVPNGNILMHGSGINRTITITPSSFQSGTATITILASDGFLSASTSFQLTVGAANTPPVVAAPASLVGDSYSETQVPIVITDRESRPEDLVLAAASYNATVLPDANISFGGSGSNRVVKCRPVPGKSGDVTVSLAVSDGRAITRRSFRLSVQQGTAPRTPISLRRNGRGTVKPLLDGELLAIGQRYTITAVPAPDELFVQWRGSVNGNTVGQTILLTDPKAPSISFIMVSNLVLEVTFTNNPYLAIKGPYNGLFHEAAEVRQASSGNFIVTPTDRGTYTGTLRLGSKKHPVSGALTLGRRGTNLITRTGTNSLTVEWDFGGGGTNQVVGRVTDGTWEAPLLGDRATFNTKTNPAPFAGSYTFIIPGQIDVGPEGDGFGTIKIDGNGGASLAGTLADGTKISFKVPLSMHGQCPVYVPLYSGYGSIMSWLTVTNRPADDVSGLLSWIRPAQIKAKYYAGGFTNEAMVIGSSYVRPVPSTNPVITVSAPAIAFSGGNLVNPFVNAIALGAGSKVTNLGSNKLSLSIATASGLFKGSVTDPSTGKSFSFSGALLQKQNAGAGFLLGTNRSSRVVLDDSIGN